jgi:hypothetical protein
MGYIFPEVSVSLEYVHDFAGTNEAICTLSYQCCNLVERKATCNYRTVLACHGSYRSISNRRYCGSSFFGAGTQFVLRLIGTNRYQLLGSCYVHGAMDGELVKPHDTPEEVNIDDLLQQDFKIF